MTVELRERGLGLGLGSPETHPDLERHPAVSSHYALNLEEAQLHRHVHAGPRVVVRALAGRRHRLIVAAQQMLPQRGGVVREGLGVAATHLHLVRLRHRPRLVIRGPLMAGVRNAQQGGQKPPGGRGHGTSAPPHGAHRTKRPPKLPRVKSA